jgi:beta-phosphoglucomutase
VSEYGAIFDMDGVLVDSYRAHLESWQQTARAHGVEMTERQFAETFGRTSREIITRLWGGRIREEDVPAFDAEKEAAYRRVIRADFPEMPGAGELLAALHAAGFRIAVGSSGPPENVRAVMECLPNAGLIDAAVHGRDVAHGKPHPEVFLNAAEKLRLPPARCAVVEDAVHGVEAARAAGMAAVALTGTAPREQLARRADLVVDSLGELTPAAIRRLIDAAGE